MTIEYLNFSSDSQSNTEDEISKRYDNRPGFELVSLVSVGLPVTRITLTVLTLLRKPIPPIEEFVLKSIDACLSSIEEINNFLGLEQSIVKNAMINLRQAENIDLIASQESKFQEWKLTKKGKTTLEEARIIVPEERSYPINFDRMLGKPRWYGKLEENKGLLRPKDLRYSNILEIPAYPAKLLELDDLNLNDVEKMIHQIAKDKKYKKEKQRDFIGLKAMEKRENFFQEAFALVYKQKDSNELQIAFAIDGRLSDEHESAFARAKGGKKDRIIKQLRENVLNQSRELKSLAEAKFGSGILEEAEKYEQQITSVREQVQEKTTQLETEINLTRQDIEIIDNEEEKKELKNKLEKAVNEIAELNKRLNSLISSTPIRFLKTYDHRPLLEEALKDSKERLLIISPWIRANASNSWLIDSLEKLLKRGVKVFIGYGFGDESEENRRDYDIEAENKIKKLAKRYQDNFVFKRLGDTHSKILVSDQKFAIVGSFNWLSFKGDPNRTFRDERSILVSYPQKIDELFDNEIKRLDLCL
ncbi:hypothetical protein IQ215_07860 [Cyanobacterium stanieri LEGE 03274]|uniref:PLD phosphodiesterase domain-containing protein n=1 Tax=Cyanobacterium stanieri LEGE 03274 TaxID=1828756 RepID=A0ABR9V3Y8_9CHRO|nr:phospholipase D-like domain-containing protein [Cyanobacterium stanieri]MBE9222611.1 hypothetical protein [Cyanobacterium stanieri LEGE 03274]